MGLLSFTRFKGSDGLNVARGVAGIEGVVAMHPSDVLLQVRLLVRTKHTVRAALLLVFAAEYLLVLDQIPFPLVALRAPRARILVLHPILGFFVRVVFKGAGILHHL